MAVRLLIKYLSKINYTYLTTSCLLPFAFPNQEINFAQLLISNWYS
jgi:hypothetical protein